MTTVAVLGAGAGGAAAIAELSARGHRLRLWNRSAETLRPFQDAGGVAYTGVLGKGKAVPEAITDDLGAALAGAEVALVCLPTMVLADVARALIDAGAPDIPIVLNPGHTGGALEFHAVFTAAGQPAPPIAEFSTLTYIARKYTPDEVTVTLAANHIWCTATQTCPVRRSPLCGHGRRRMVLIAEPQPRRRPRQVSRQIGIFGNAPRKVCS